MMLIKYAKGVKQTVSKLFSLLTPKHRAYLIMLFFLTLALSLIETIGISAIMPFVTIASNPSMLDEGMYKKVFDFFRFTSKSRFVLFFGIAIIGFYIFRSLYSILYAYLQAKFGLGMSRIISKKIFNVYLTIPYRQYVQKNPSENATAIGEAGNVSNMLQNCLQICTELLMVLMLYTLLLTLNLGMTLVLTALLVLALIGILQIVKISKKQGRKRYEAAIIQNRTVYETFWNLKFVKLIGSERKALQTFDDAAKKLARANIIVATVGQVPKNLLESVGFSLLVGAILFILWAYHAPDQVIPIIAMYALALYRILPSMNRMLQNVNTVFSLQRSLEIVSNALNQETEREEAEPVTFEKNIRLEHVSFSYVTGGEVLRDISLEIKKGERVAITGESGGGKTTLVDIITGLHKPIKGRLYIDDILITNENVRSWRSKIGYIPQDIFLFDGPVAENVAFGAVFDEQKVIQALEKANIWSFLTQKDGIATRVGSGGILLSGGQRQRIGIARALYSDPEVLVLDEATSSLDNETEGRIMEEMYQISGDKTLIVIAHRLSTVERCERRININGGCIVSAPV